MVGHREGGSRQSGDRLQRDLILTAEDAGEQILVVSDLHLGSGREPDTGRYRPRENFFADAEFGKFLKRQADRQTERGAGAGILVLNGDIIDFVRIMSVPSDEDIPQWIKDLDDLGRVVSEKELRDPKDREKRRFGLRTTEFESVWRVQRVIRGHQQFFSSLGWWLEPKQSGRIVFVKGNHDLELRWPLVRRAICQAIRDDQPDRDVDELVDFCDQSVRIENVYIEHGHRFEPATTVYGAAKTKNGREIRLPVGSVVNRYLINKLEEIEPFLNNIKPVGDAVWAVALRHPLRFWDRCLRAAPYVCGSVRRFWFRDGIGILVFFGAVFLYLLSLTALAALLLGLLVSAGVMPVGGLPFAFPKLGILKKVLLVLVVVPAALWFFPRGAYRIAAELRRWMFRKGRFPDAEDRYAQKLFEHLRRLCFPSGAKIVYGVIGHTHRPDIQVLDRGESRRYFYLNSGTWAPNWRDKRSNLRSGTEFSFLRFDWRTTRRRRLGEYRHSSRVWRDDRGIRGGSVEHVIIAPE